MNVVNPHALVVVTPVYEDVDSSSHLFWELQKELGPQVFVVVVDDGSVREPVEVASLSKGSSYVWLG